MPRSEFTAEDRERREGKCLCHRCEHRALNLETGWQPRMECGAVTSSKYSCYMFKPVRPVVMGKSDPADPRPFMGPALIASRACAVRAADDKDIRLRAKDKGKGSYLVYWEAIRNSKKGKG